MLASLHDILPMVRARKTCLPGFDIAGGQSDFLLGALEACREARCPALLLVWAPGAGYIGLEACAELVKSVAGRCEVPVVLHLDHGRDEAVVERALKLGFRSVMFDGSACDFEENVRRTAEMAKLAHAASATIEGELGRLGSEQGPGEQKGVMTDPLEAGQFVRRTGVDLLAPAVGNAHGFYKSPPNLRFDLIERIAAETHVPLSLHGGTGLSFADLRRAAECGVAKVNVASQLHRDFSEAIRAAASPASPGGPPPGWWKILQAGRSAIRQTVSAYLSALGVNGLI